MRLRAYQALGIEDIWVSIVHPKNEAEKLKYALSDNDRVGYYLEDELHGLVQEHGLEINMDDYKVDMGDAISLTELLNQFNNDPEEDKVPEVSSEPAKSKPGEIYQLGNHRLMCGDSSKLEQVEKLMDGKKAAMVFTDPPYNVDYGNTMKDKMRGNDRTIMNDAFKTNQEFYQFLFDSIGSFRPFVQGDIYICMSSSELHTLQKAFIDQGGHWSTFIIWVKNTFTLGRSNYQRQYEPILYGWFDGSSHYWSGARNLGDVVKTEDMMVDASGDKYIKVDNLPGDVWEFPKPTSNKEHPTMKPIALVSRALINSSKKGDVVLDTFGGSGSTLIACEQVERYCYTMELDPKYCDVIRKRYANLIGETDWERGTPNV